MSEPRARLLLHVQGKTASAYVLDHALLSDCGRDTGAAPLFEMPMYLYGHEDPGNREYARAGAIRMLNGHGAWVRGPESWDEREANGLKAFGIIPNTPVEWPPHAARVDEIANRVRRSRQLAALRRQADLA